jgi:hypothetical protein
LRFGDTFHRIFLRNQTAHPANCLLNGSQLVEDIPAGAFFVNHALNPAHLPFNPSQALANLGARILIFGTGAGWRA